MHRNKKGFTLAEVILTLTIVGVIASMTVPDLLQSIQNTQIVSALKQLYSDTQQAAKLIMIDNAGTLADGLGTTTDTLMEAFCNKMSCVKKCNANTQPGECFHSGTTGWKNLYGTDGALSYNTAARMILSNGALVTFTFYSASCSNGSFVFNGENTLCAYIMMDVNGFKGPNTLGRDIQRMYLTKYGVYPGGSDLGGTDPVAYCNPASNMGWQGCTCAAKILREGAINY